MLCSRKNKAARPRSPRFTAFARGQVGAGHAGALARFCSQQAHVQSPRAPGPAAETGGCRWVWEPVPNPKEQQGQAK